MIRFLADENFDGHIFRGLLERKPDIDILRVQDIGLAGETDQAILAWAAGANRIVLSHDAKTLHGYALERVEAGQRMPGVCHVPRRMPVGQAIEDILIVEACCTEADFESQIQYLPL